MPARGTKAAATEDDGSWSVTVSNAGIVGFLHAQLASGSCWIRCACAPFATSAAFVASTMAGPPHTRICRSPQLPYLVTTSGNRPVWRTCRPRGGSWSGYSVAHGGLVEYSDTGVTESHGLVD